MTSTTSPLAPDFVKESIEILTTGIAEATAHTYRMFWEILLSFLAQHLLATFAVLVFVLLAAIVEYLIIRRWAALGSVLYNYFYFGILFLIGAIFGPEVYANDYFPLVATIVYLISFSIVGFILVTTGVKRRYR
jgi:hypothetical protein